MRGSVAPQRFRNRYGAAFVLEVLEQRDHRSRGDRGAVQRRHMLKLSVSAGTDVEPARLVVGGVRRRRQLAVALLRREPPLDVVLLHGGGTEIAGSDVDDAVR